MIGKSTKPNVMRVAESVGKIPHIEKWKRLAGRNRRHDARLKMARGSDRRTPDLRINELSPEKCKGPTTFTYDTDGKLHAHTRPVPEFRMKRARRILWECRQQPDWARTHAAFYRHPSLKNVPYRVLKQLVEESERSNGR